jgi:hypothetical protein
MPALYDGNLKQEPIPTGVDRLAVAMEAKGKKKRLRCNKKAGNERRCDIARR